MLNCASWHEMAGFHVTLASLTDALIFTVSGNVPEEPVCTADGYVFEKRLVEKHLEVRVLPAPGSGMTAGAQVMAGQALVCHFCRCMAAVCTL